jgi:AraC-like DNA-binding protein
MASNAADFAAIRFSTDHMPERDRLPIWREEFARGLVRVDIEPLSERPFRAEATLRALPGMRSMICSGSAARFLRTPELAAKGDDSVGLVVNLGKRAIASQRGRELVLGRGDAVLFLTHEPALLTSTSHLGLLFPRAPLAARVNDINDASMRLIPRGTQSLQLLISYMNALHDKPALDPPKLRRTVVRHIHDLTALVLGPQRALGEGGLTAVSAARLQVALRHIAESFHEPDLTVAAIARRQQVSPRYLQRLLETTGMSFTARVNELRMQRAFALLTEAHKRRISDVALQSGFSDISHFNRLFRTRFGDTPRGTRARLKRTAAQGPSAD